MQALVSPGTKRSAAPAPASAAQHRCGLRRQRKSNFSNAEVEILVREVAARRDVLFSSRGRTSCTNGVAKSTEKMCKWREVAAVVNGAEFGERRTVREVRKKWENVVSSFRRKLRQPNLLTSLIGGLGRGIRCPADEALACANAYCGMTPKIINRSEINRHDLEEEDEDPELLLQPEVQIDEDHDSPPMEFGNSTNCKVEFNKGDDSAASPQIGTGQSSEEEAPPKEIEMQKLQVMKKLLDVQSKRLKVERKRLKVERMRLQIELQKTENNSGS
ncbi:myb/SANT-like DNA-binding domain-containing protein 4 isoform X1 [Neocloeon triangulifer]|uniref:myb/SANT-like DNA-binding domain-containing protein 4 isoform X1 n=1 Tax=Neocloeon triangulifer TaxID=2078957 RepID=UPI00286F8102|nr:myb/SANT-like DNA-binding domain-containing protein 4 isoform X1 [Neocloeon triangulifer]